MLEDFTIETFADRLGEHFGIAVEEGTIGAELVEATALGEASGSRAPFSLVFLGPEEPLLPQSTYRFLHEALGEFEIFIVPIGRDDSGVRYEAVFA